MKRLNAVISRKLLLAGAGVVLAGTAALALSRVGVLDLPSVPGKITAAESGLAELPDLHRLDQFVRGDGDASKLSGIPAEVVAAAQDVRAGMKAVADGNEEAGLEQMRAGLKRAPSNLVFTNAYRMTTFQLRRDFLAESRKEGHLVVKFPPHIADEPFAFLKQLDDQLHLRETRLALALAWVDQMLLFPALEIKAPASVEAVDLLTAALDNGEPNYVPALFARGLNHLHRPARLVWPETMRTAPDAAAQDIGRCVAIGRKVGIGSPHLQAILAITLGDSYIKAGRFGVARSWWQIAQNLCRDDDIQAAVHRRYGWADEKMIDELEAELDRARAELARPMTDLAFVWN